MPSEAKLLFGLWFAAVLGIGLFRYLTVRGMAERGGADPHDANALALFGGEAGPAAAYLGDRLSGDRGHRTVEERLSQLDALQAKGLVTAAEYRAQKKRILDDL